MIKFIRWPFQVLGALFALAGCSGADALNALVPSDGYTRHAEAYGPLSRQGVDVYEPKLAPPLGGRTVVVFFYGGSWSGGKKENYKFVAEALTSQGYLTMVPDYRVHPEAVYPTFVEDGTQALKWAVENAARFGGNADRVVLMGHSAGAHIAALVALDPQFLKAVQLPPGTVKGFVSLAGPFSFEPLEFRSTRAVFGHLKDPQVVRPINFAKNPAPPMLLLHGRDDTTVGPYNSADMTAALKAVGNPVTQIVYPDVAHVGIVISLTKLFRGKASTLQDTTTFINGLFQNTATTDAR